MAEHRKPVGVRISTHAIDRFHERFPDVPHESIRRIAYREVLQALAAGRMRSKLPEWVHRQGYATGRKNSSRFVFNEELTRCYAIVESNSGERADEFGKQWVVKTTLASLTNEQIEEERRLRRLQRQNHGSGTGLARAGRGGGRPW